MAVAVSWAHSEGWTDRPRSPHKGPCAVGLIADQTTVVQRESGEGPPGSAPAPWGNRDRSHEFWPQTAQDSLPAERAEGASWARDTVIGKLFQSLGPSAHLHHVCLGDKCG